MKVVGVFSQKGGQGKSTIIQTLATKIQTEYNEEKNSCRVLVIDADFPQFSIHALREREKKVLMDDSSDDVYFINKYKKIYSNGIKPFFVEAKDLLDVPDYIEKVRDKFDLILVDIVGSTNTEGLDSYFYNLFDYIIVPTLIDLDDVHSNLSFIKNVIMPLKMGRFSPEYIEDFGKNKNKAIQKYNNSEYRKFSNLKDFSILFNRVENNTNGDLKSVSNWKEVLNSKGITTFEQLIFKKKKYTKWHIQDYKSGVKSTLFPTKDTYVNRLTQEFINFIKL